MELRYSDADESFRAELHALARGRRCPRSRRSRARDAWAERRKWDTDWQRRLFDAGYAGLHWPKEYGGRGASPTEQLIFYEETARARAPVRRRQLRRHAARGPDAHRRGHRRAEGRAPAEDPARRRGVVPGLLRAGRGFRPRVAAHPRRARRRRLRPQRPEDLVLVRPDRRRRRVPRAHRSRRAEEPRHLVADPADGPARHRGAAAARPCSAASEFAEVFLTDVRVPVANRVGAENDGWRVTNVTLKYERGTAFVSELVDSHPPRAKTSRRSCDDPAHRRRARSLHRRVRRAVGADEAQRLAVDARHGRARARW